MNLSMEFFVQKPFPAFSQMFFFHLKAMLFVISSVLVASVVPRWPRCMVKDAIRLVRVPLVRRAAQVAAGIWKVF